MPATARFHPMNKALLAMTTSFHMQFNIETYFICLTDNLTRKQDSFWEVL